MDEGLQHYKNLVEGLENYKILVEIFKGYLDTVLTVHTSFYAFTGAIAAYYLAHREERPYLKHSLILPFLLGGTLAYVSFAGMCQALTLNATVYEIQKVMGMPESPPVVILRRTLFVVGSLDVVICFSLVLLFLWPRCIFKDKKNPYLYDSKQQSHN
jgi:hypothetical protein